MRIVQGVASQSAWQRAKLQDQYPSFFARSSRGGGRAPKGTRPSATSRRLQYRPARLLLGAGGAALGDAPRPQLREAGSAGAWRAQAAGGARAAQRRPIAPRRRRSPKGGKKKVRRKVRGSLWEDWPDQGSRDSALARRRERSGAGRPCVHSRSFSAPSLPPEKGESLAC